MLIIAIDVSQHLNGTMVANHTPDASSALLLTHKHVM